jgi:hypothetical protein
MTVQHLRSIVISHQASPKFLTNLEGDALREIWGALDGFLSPVGLISLTFPEAFNPGITSDFKALKAAIEREFERRADPEDTEVVLLPGFLSLFQDEAKARMALDAAMDAKIIDKKSRTALGGKKIVPAIIQFWDAVSDHKFNLTHTRATKEAIVDTCQPQCEAIAEQFGVSIGKSAIYDHGGQRKGHYFTTVSRILGGK